MATDENLLNAFIEESQANKKYLAYAKKADEEGYPQIAKLLRAVAQGETVHAHALLKAIGGVKSTQENLQKAIQAESIEFNQKYPEFIEQAQQEKVKSALASFQHAMAVERVHYNLCIEALNAAKDGNDMPTAKIFVCSVCGNTFLEKIPQKCPICGASKERFDEIG
jgi:rubrerythrin